MDKALYVHDEESHAKSNMLGRMVASQSGIVVALVGPRFSGKSSMLRAFAARTAVPTVWKCASELVSRDCLVQLARSACTVCFSERLRIVEGEVLAISEDKIVLRTVDMESSFDIGVNMRRELERERVSVGDVIRIYKDSGFVASLGRRGGGAMGQVGLPEGECIKDEHVKSELTLDELDVINSKEAGEELLFTSETVAPRIQRGVDAKVAVWVKEGKVTLERGLLIIEDADELTDDILEAILDMREGKYSPTVVLECRSQPDRTRNRLVLLEMPPSNDKRMGAIIDAHAGQMGISLDGGAREYLLDVAREKNISYAIALLRAGSRSATVTEESLRLAVGVFSTP